MILRCARISSTISSVSRDQASKHLAKIWSLIPANTSFSATTLASNPVLHPITESFANSFSTSSTTSTITPPSKPTSTWERSAKLVKNTEITSKNNQYVEQIRQTTDPALHLKTIEEELCGAIGKALGRQGEKILMEVGVMKEEYGRYLEFLGELRTGCGESVWEGAVECAQRYNEARQRAIKARWELIVHRQAVGFRVDNHSVVHSTFPIGEALPGTRERLEEYLREEVEEGRLHGQSKKTKKKEEVKQFGDQLDWWQRVGRWR